MCSRDIEIYIKSTCVEFNRNPAFARLFNTKTTSKHAWDHEFSGVSESLRQVSNLLIDVVLTINVDYTKLLTQRTSAEDLFMKKSNLFMRSISHSTDMPNGLALYCCWTRTRGTTLCNQTSFIKDVPTDVTTGNILGCCPTWVHSKKVLKQAQRGFDARHNLCDHRSLHQLL